MKRSLLTAVVVLSVFGLVASASAGQKYLQQDQNSNSNGNFQNYAQNLGLNSQSGQGIAGLVSKFTSKPHKHHDEPKLDPNRPDDRVPVEPVEPVAPQGRPGFVWVDGHWERERAPKTPKVLVDPIPPSVGPVVRDHRTTGSPIVRDHRTTSGPIVRDHRTTAGTSGVTVFGNSSSKPTGTTWQPSGTTPPGPIVRDHRTTSGPIVRDHRDGASQGGVSVTTTPGGRTRDNAITGSGPNPLELGLDGLSKVGNLFGIGYGSVTSGDGSRDHRTPAPQPIVRDHRTVTTVPGPIVRDHR